MAVPPLSEDEMRIKLLNSINSSGKHGVPAGMYYMGTRLEVSDEAAQAYIEAGQAVRDELVEEQVEEEAVEEVVVEEEDDGLPMQKVGGNRRR